MPSLSQTLAREDPALLEKLWQRATDEALTRRSLAAATTFRRKWADEEGRVGIADERGQRRG